MQMKTVVRGGLVGASLAWVCSASSAAAPAAQRYFEELAVSPDARFVASVEGDRPVSGGMPPVRELVIRSADGQHETQVRLPCGAAPQCWPSSPAWTPDGTRLSFALRRPGSHARSIYQVRADGSELRQLLSFNGTIGALRYSRSGALAMLATAGAKKEVGATEAGAPIEGDLDAAPPEQRLAVLDPGAKQLRWVSRPDYFVYEYDWLPDGSGLVGTAAPGDGDRNWWVAKLYGFPVNGAAEQLIYAPRTPREQLAEPKVAPDGQHIGLIVGLMSDFGSTGGDLYVVPLTGGTPVNLTQGAHSTVMSIGWQCDGHLHATVLAGDKTQRLDFGALAQPGQVRTLWETSDDLRELSTSTQCASGGLEARIDENFNRAAEIEVRDAQSQSTWRALTQRNAALRNDIEVHSVSWHSDGYAVQGWLLLPAHREAGAKLPLIVDVHGGPAAAWQPHFVGSGTVRSLLDKGYAYLMPNPRGSFGQGEAFTQANAKDFGGGDLRDILGGVEAVVKDYSVDGARVGITGHSYGGFMTMWAVTQTHFFKAAVASAGIANWQSYYGENGIDQWMIPYFGASVYEDPAIYARSSAINYIKNVRTPTLSLVGAADIECPAPQTQEFNHAMKTYGLPSTAVIYPGEGHRFVNPEHLADREKRILEWFDRYLK